MYYTTKEFLFYDDEELDLELTKLHRAGYEAWSYREELIDDGRKATIKFKVK